MASQQRTRLGVDERREQLLRIGIEIFSARPYDDISIDEIAGVAGISKGLLYHYFPSKRDFYVAAIRTAVQDMESLTEPDPSLDPLERLRHSVDAYLDYAENHAQGYLTVYRGGIGADAEVRALVDRSRALMAERLLAGLSPDAAPVLRATVRGWIGYVEAAVLEWLERRELDRDRVRELLIHALGGSLWAAQQVEPDLGLDLPEYAHAR
jgi:AcrR family transcriptional regulator